MNKNPSSPKAAASGAASNAPLTAVSAASAGRVPGGAVATGVAADKRPVTPPPAPQAPAVHKMTVSSKSKASAKAQAAYAAPAPMPVPTSR